MEFQEHPRKLGILKRTHGVHGGLVVESELKFADTVAFPAWSFIELDGGLVPFQVVPEACFIRDDHQVVLFIKGIDSPEKADPLLQKSVFFPESFWQTSFSFESLLAGFNDYKVLFDGLDTVGKMIELIEIPGNPVLSIAVEGREVLVPATEKFIKEVDEKSRTITLQIPEGLLDLN